MNDYVLVSKLGEGNYIVFSSIIHPNVGKEGEVYCAQHIPTNTLRAIKIPNKRITLRSNQSRLKALTKEADFLINLEHPNILKGYELLKIGEDSTPFLVTEICTGGSLARKMKEEAFTAQEGLIKIVAKQILSALEYLSSKMIAHKDIKPNNILLASPNALDSLKLIDFGMSEQRKEGETLAATSGTPYYMAPEVYFGSFTEKCDVWSCGVLLYLLVTGEKPFNATSKTELKQMILYSEPNFDHPNFSKVSANCKDLIQRMLRKGERARPSAKEALRDLWFREDSILAETTASSKGSGDLKTHGESPTLKI